MENQQSSGMSKGCVVALVIGGIVVLLIALTAGACWIYKDDLVKVAGNTALTAMKTQMAEKMVEGVDTTQFNALVDAFSEEVEATENFDLKNYGEFMSKIATIMEDKEISQEELVELSDAMVEMYPNLESVRIIIPETDEIPVEEITEEAGTE